MEDEIENVRGRGLVKEGQGVGGEKAEAQEVSVAKERRPSAGKWRLHRGGFHQGGKQALIS